MSRVLRKISALNSMRNDWMVFAGRMMKEQQVGQAGAALLGDDVLLRQKDANGQQQQHLCLQAQHSGKLGHRYSPLV